MVHVACDAIDVNPIVGSGLMSGVVIAMRAALMASRQLNGSMAPGAAAPIEQRLAVMAVDIRRLIPAAEVRLFGSRARGQSRPDSDVDLLITAPDAWLHALCAHPPATHDIARSFG